MEELVFKVTAPLRAKLAGLSLTAIALAVPAIITCIYVARGDVRGALLPILITLGVLVALSLLILLPLYKLRIAVSADEVEVKGSLIKAKFKRSKLTTCRLVSLQLEEALTPVARAMGMGLLGFLVGWFVLESGKQAFVVIRDVSGEAVYMEFMDGSAALLQPDDVKSFAKVLQSLGWM